MLHEKKNGGVFFSSSFHELRRASRRRGRLDIPLILQTRQGETSCHFPSTALFIIYFFYGET